MIVLQYYPIYRLILCMTCRNMASSQVPPLVAKGESCVEGFGESKIKAAAGFGPICDILYGGFGSISSSY